MQKKIIVIGGGFAGLTAAVYLIKNNFKVLLLEASPKLGGRAYSFFDKETRTIVDNGQHILMGCYKDTLKFLSLIGALKNFSFQKNLTLNFIKEGFQIVPLKSNSVIYPFNLIFGLINYRAITIRERLLLLRVFLKLPFCSASKFSHLNIRQWLEKEKQSQGVQDAFWKILVVGALNTNPEKASAKIFIDILKKIFLKGNKASTIVLPKHGLSESYIENAEECFRRGGGEIHLSESVKNIQIKNSKLIEIETDSKVYNDFEYVISTIPVFALSKILPDKVSIILPEFEYSTILNIHIWLKKNVIPDGFFGFINSPLHWVFNKNSHLNIVISDANEFVNKSDDELIYTVKREMQRFFLLESDSISNYKIIKEKRATFIPSINVIENRPLQKTRLENFILAGDWVDTGLPSTIESAVKSGRIAAEIIIGQN